MPSKIRIAHLVLSLELGGLETLVVNFLSTIDRDRFEISVGCLEKPGTLSQNVENLGMQVTTFGKREGIDWKVIPRITRWLRRERSDILHTHNAAAHFYGSIGGKLAGVGAIIHTKHGRDWPDKPRKVLLNRISSLLTNKIVTVSKNSFEVARDIEKVPTKKLTIIHNGIDTTRFAPTGEGSPMAAISNVPPGSFIIGTVARLSPEKDQKTLIDAFARVSSRISSSHLVIAGDGPSREELETYAQGLACRDRIRFIGTVDNIPDILRCFSVFALTSLTEGISLALLEAAAAGVPAVVTDAGGNSEVVLDGETGYVVPQGDPDAAAEKIESLSRDNQLRTSAGMKARKRIETLFSLKGMTEQYESLYKEYFHESA